MPYLTLRWALWGAVFAYAALGMVGLSRFMLPPFESIPLASIARSPSVVEVASDQGRITVAAESADRTGIYQERRAGRQGLSRAVAGTVGDFPAGSVTYLSNIGVYLVHSSEGFVALWNRDSDRGYAVRWDPQSRLFVEPREGMRFSSTGRCDSGPCFHDLGRYAVETVDNTVVVDLQARYLRPRR